MASFHDKAFLEIQYSDASRLQARAALHERFSINPKPWTQWVFEQFHFPGAARILEVGCGPGGLWIANADSINEDWALTLSDISAGMLDEAVPGLAAAGIRADCVAADVANLPFPDRAFDAVIANHMLYHVADLSRALSEIARVLTPQGRLYAATNGVNHAKELRELVADILPSSPFVLGLNIKAFSLENAPGHLRSHFSQVDLRLYEDALEITEVQPILDYILSTMTTPQVDRDILAKLTSRVSRIIAEQGSMHVCKSSGLLLAGRPLR